MVELGKYMTLPDWNGRVLRFAELWTLRKGQRAAVCYLCTHPIGGEVRVEVGGEMVRTEAGRDGVALVELGMSWKPQFEEKGWR